MEDKIFIEVISKEVNLDTDTTSVSGVNGRKTYTTGMISSRAMQLIEVDSDLIKKIRRQIEKFSEAFSDVIIADETELEFSIGLTGSGNICILTGGTQLGVKVTMKLGKQ